MAIIRYMKQLEFSYTATESINLTSILFGIIY